MRKLCVKCKETYTDDEILNMITGEMEPMCKYCREAFEERVAIKMDSGIAERTALLQTWYEGGK